MRIHHLSLANFRNYTRLELDFSTPLTLLQGDNAQGKTNLLEAIYVLATSRTPHAVAEREMVNWLALEESFPYARLVADVERAGRRQRLEIVVAPQNGEGGNGPTFRKQVKINGVARRALDLVGLLPVVLFLPEDIELVSGAPAVRRRYLNVALCQIDAAYCRALAEYNRVLTRRSALLRHLRERGGNQDQMRFWDERLVMYGSTLLARRQEAISALEGEAQTRQRALTQGREHLRLRYLPGIDLAPDRPEEEVLPMLEAARIEALFGEELRAGREKELAAGTCLYGPHRDDLRFLIGGRDLRLYGSRGQQRTVALAMKLAEMAVMTQALGEPPLLLLDDMMSELDARRRAALLSTLNGVPQAICTATDWSDFDEGFRARARCLRVVEGRIEEAERSA
ncbi:MAG: DNA replication/repair protein RecF [Anaerolineae bacterium]|nr:DNA replication/repair protein RecF [Anaerolineae bacterium]